MKVKFQIEATLAQLNTLCRAVESLQAQLMCTDRQMLEIVLVLEELVANAIRHGGGSTIWVELDKEWEELVITITDDGRPFDPTRVPTADTQQPLERRRPGGLGIHLVHHYTDSFSYSRTGDSNIITLKKII